MEPFVTPAFTAVHEVNFLLARFYPSTKQPPLNEPQLSQS